MTFYHNLLVYYSGHDTFLFEKRCHTNKHVCVNFHDWMGDTKNHFPSCNCRCNCRPCSESLGTGPSTSYISNHFLNRLVWRFKEILQSGEKELLHTWISEAAALELNELTSFLNGIKKDIDAVENACTLPYNNGLAEGSINKLKTIKRIMYGRNSFELLRNKLLLLESRKFN